MLKILKNPKTETYQSLKKSIFDREFPWYYQNESTSSSDHIDGHTNHPHYSHIILRRPDDNKNRYTEVKSSGIELVVKCISEIFEFNNIDFNSDFFFTRINVNCTFPIEGNQFTMPHHDHKFPHTNFICYLTDNHGGGGRTFIEGYPPHEPIEDQVIIFNGKHSHYMELPRKGRRIIIVGTMILWEQ